MARGDAIQAHCLGVYAKPLRRLGGQHHHHPGALDRLFVFSSAVARLQPHPLRRGDRRPLFQAFCPPARQAIPLLFAAGDGDPVDCRRAD